MIRNTIALIAGFVLLSGVAKAQTASQKTPPAGSNGQIQYNNNGLFGGYGIGTGLGVSGGNLNATGATSGGLYNGLINVQDPTYGAKGDCVTDDTAAIQAGYNAACVASTSGTETTLFIPAAPGKCYILGSPLLDACANTVPIIGDSIATTLLQPAASPEYFPLILHYPSTYVAALGTITAASLATGSGNSLLFPQTANWYLILNDAMAIQSLNGLSAFTFEGYFNWNPSGNHSYAIFASGGNDGANPSAPNPLANNSTPHILLQVTGDGSVAGTLDSYLDINGTINHNSSATAVTKSATHHIALVLDPNGGTPLIRLFVDGTQTTGSPFSVSGGGTIIKQLVDETMSLGAYQFGPTQWPDSAATNVWMGNMDSIRISKIARYTANFSAPTAKFATDANTLLLLNFTNVGTLNNPHTPLIQTTTPTSNGYLVIRTGTNAAQGAAANISHLSLNNAAYSVMILVSPTSDLEDIITSGASQASLYLAENSYSSIISHVSLNMANIGIATSNVADADISGLEETGDTYGWVAQSGGHLYGKIISPSSSGLNGVSLTCATSTCDYLISGVGLDVEAGGSAIPVKITGALGAVILNDVDLQTNAGANLPGIYVNTLGAATPAIGITLNGVHYEGGTPAEIIHVLSNPNLVTWTSPVVNGKAWYKNTTIPVADASATPYITLVGAVPATSTVDNLPTGSAELLGTPPILVTDCVACTSNSTCVHLGSVNCPEYWNGSAWVH